MEIAELGRRLRRQRNMADYDVYVNKLTEIVSDATADAEDLKRLLDAL